MPPSEPLDEDEVTVASVFLDSLTAQDRPRGFIHSYAPMQEWDDWGGEIESVIVRKSSLEFEIVFPDSSRLELMHIKPDAVNSMCNRFRLLKG